MLIYLLMFQHAAARRRLDSRIVDELVKGVVSTRSRPKAAGFPEMKMPYSREVSTRSRPKAAGNRQSRGCGGYRFQHAAARRRLVCDKLNEAFCIVFQHAAARRRLDLSKEQADPVTAFQHAAARRRLALCQRYSRNQNSFNTQPPEGGWENNMNARFTATLFQHAAARRRLVFRRR